MSLQESVSLEDVYNLMDITPVILLLEIVFHSQSGV